MSIQRTTKHAPAWVAAACSVALSGCGGSGGVITPEPAVFQAHGMTASPATPVRVTGAEPQALAALLPDPENRFAPVSAALGADADGMAPRLASDVYVRTISSDGHNGFHVSYVLDGEEREVHFRVSDYGTPHDPEGYSTQMDDARVRLFSETDSFRNPDKNAGAADLRYFDASRLEVDDPASGERRIFAVYGARTAEGGLPAGEARYLGFMSARVVAAGASPETGTLFGILGLAADFEASALDGTITGLIQQEPGSLLPLPLSLTSRFEIEDGAITDGRFTARLEGVDSNTGAPLDETVRGYEGGVLGEFYGPGAEEIGGVLNARSEAHGGRVLAGWFGGQAVATEIVAPSGEVSIQSIGIERDAAASTVRRTEARVTEVVFDLVDGTLVTYEVDGVEQQVRFTVSDFDPSGAGFAQRIGNREYRVETAGGTLLSESEFDFFDVGGWVVVDHTDDGTVLTERRGFGAYGGRMYAESELERAAGSDTRRTYTGRLDLTANFAAGNVSGRIDAIRDTTPGAADPHRLLRPIDILEGRIREGRFTATLNDDVQDATGFLGEMSGQFFGPAAVEVGGVLAGRDHLNDAVVHGWFGGTRQIDY